MQLNTLVTRARALAGTPVGAVVRRTVDVVLAVALFLVVATTVGTDAASAHDAVVDASPKPGALLTRVPETVTLRFAGRITRISLDVRDACGRTVPAQVDTAGTVVTATLPRQAPADPRDANRSGQWDVAWQVVGSDGHLVQGTVPFVVRGVPACDASPVANVREAAAEAADGGFPALPIGAAILALLGLLTAALLRRLPSGRRS